MVNTRLEELTILVPPPPTIVHGGSLQEWTAIEEDIGQEIPEDLISLSSRYGSGSFVDGGFSLGFHNVFAPRFSDMVRYHRAIISSSQDAGRCVNASLFKIGDFEWDGEEQGDLCTIFWETSGSLEEWPICIASESVPLQRFNMRLFDFLIRAFRNELRVQRFPERFVDLRFVARRFP